MAVTVDFKSALAHDQAMTRAMSCGIVPLNKSEKKQRNA